MEVTLALPTSVGLENAEEITADVTTPAESVVNGKLTLLMEANDEETTPLGSVSTTEEVIPLPSDRGTEEGADEANELVMVVAPGKDITSLETGAEETALKTNNSQKSESK